MSVDVDVGSHLADALTPLSTTDPAKDGDGLRAIGDALADHRVVGLGEATHGTREFFELKHRVVRHLVEEQGLRLFGIEACFGETLAVNDYVLRGEGSAEDALEGIGFWTWNTEEVREFVEWLREFNDGRERGDCVKFYGYDMQFTTASATRVGDYLNRVDADVYESVADELAALADEGLRSHDTDGLADRLDRADALTETVADTLDDNRDAYATATSGREWEVARQHVTALEQAVELGWTRERADDYASEEGLRTRDRVMAENVAWILDHAPHDRIALWAHNGHVKRGGIEHEGAIIPTMGDHLADRYGGDYYALGFDFHHGSFQAIGDLEDDDDRGLRRFTVDGSEDCLAAAFADAGYPIAFLGFDSANAEITNWLDDEHDLRSVGALFDHDKDDNEYWDTCNLTSDFDGLLYVEETTRAVPLGRDN